MINDEKIEIKKKKYKKYTLSGIIIIILSFLAEYFGEFFLDSLFESKIKEDTSYNYEILFDDSVEQSESIKAPFEASDINVEIVKVEKETVPPYKNYSIKARITNNSNTPLKTIFLSLSFDNGESSAWVGGDNITIMPGKSYVSNGVSDGEIKDIDSGEVLSGSAYWLGENKETFYTQMDFLLNTTDTIKSNNN